jgi:hypothetical protein
MEPDYTAIFLYNALHLVLSLGIGQVVASFVAQAERRPNLAYVFLALIVGGFVVTIFSVGAMTGSFRPLLPWWSIVVANSAAVALAGAWVVWRRPEAWRAVLPFLANR